MYSSEEFYTKFAPFYEKYSSGKKDYISAVNNFIKNDSKLYQNVVDIGGGNGKRSKEVADSIYTSSLTIIDNSEGMISLANNTKELSIVFADISDKEYKSNKKYGVAMCLWNVLGHISTAEKRKIALINITNLMEDGGLLFIDVNNRYNVLNYGLKAVIKNIFNDIFYHNENSGDFELNINTDNGKIQTKVHVFNPFEMDKLIKSVGLKIIEKQIINYKTGKKSSNIFFGQLIYKLSKK